MLRPGFLIIRLTDVSKIFSVGYLSNYPKRLLPVFLPPGFGNINLHNL